jgi:hypothetical protein
MWRPCSAEGFGSEWVPKRDESRLGSQFRLQAGRQVRTSSFFRCTLVRCGAGCAGRPSDPPEGGTPNAATELVLHGSGKTNPNTVDTMLTALKAWCRWVYATQMIDAGVPVEA